MKFAIVLLCAFVAVASAVDPISLNDQQRERVRAAAGQCKETEGVTSERIQELRSGNFANVDRNTKCFSNCFLEKLEFIANGVPQESVIKAKLGAIVGEAKVVEVMNACNGERGADNCDTAFKLFQCYYTKGTAFL